MTMNKILFALIVFFSAACSGTNESSDKAVSKDATQTANAKTYACPMRCEGDKTYAQTGKCPVCKMDLKEVALLETDSTAHDHQ
jgi:transcription initiation factor IIE alpha subunit